MKNLVKFTGMVIALSAFLMGQATITILPNDVPKGAYTNGADEQSFIQTIYITDIGGAGTDISGGTITIGLPTGMTISDVDIDGLFNDQVAFAYTTVLANAWTLGAVTSTSIIMNAITAVNTADGDELWVFFPATTGAGLATAAVNYTFTYAGANLIASEGASQTQSITFQDTLANLAFTAAYDDPADGTAQTSDKGGVHPDPAVSNAVVAPNLPNLIIDATGAPESTTLIAAQWSNWTGNGWTAGGTDNDDVLFYLWASQDGDLKQVVNDPPTNTHRVVELDVTSGDEIWQPATENTDFDDNAASTGLVNSSLLAEGIWYFYITSSATSDWALARSDSVDVRHYPVFETANNELAAGGLDFNGDGIFQPAGADAIAADEITLESGGTLGNDGNLGGTNVQEIKIFWDFEDVDDNGYLHIFRAATAGYDTSDVVYSGTVPNRFVTGLGSDGVQLNPDTLLESGAVGNFSYDIFTDDVTFEVAGDYFLYLVANDGKHSAVQRVRSGSAGPVDLAVHVKHFPFIDFDDTYFPQSPIIIATDVEEYFVINWGAQPTDDLDADGNATINLYYTTGAAGVADLAQIMVDAGGTPIDAVTVTQLQSVGTLIASLTEDPDTKADNRFMWRIRDEAFAAGVDHWIIAHISQGGDDLLVQYSAGGGPDPTPDTDRSIRVTNGDYFTAKTPVAGETVELTGADNVVLSWDAFNKEPTDAGQVQAFMVPAGIDASAVLGSALTWTLVQADGALPWYWLFPTANNGQSSSGNSNGPNLSSNSFTLDVSTITSSFAGAGGGRPSGFFDVYYYFSSDAGVGLAAQLPTKADGSLRFDGSAGPTYNFELSPNQAVMSKGDTLTVTVSALSNSADLVSIVAVSLDIPDTYFSVIDQGSGPFIDEIVNFNGQILLNRLTTSGGVHSLDWVEEDAAPAGGEDLISLQAIISFQLVASAASSGTEFIDNLVTFINTQTRSTKIVDDSGNDEVSSIPSPGANLRMATPGSIAGNVDLEKRTDAGEVITFTVAPRGSFLSITDADYLAANGGADADGNVQLTLGADGSYELLSVPTGDYDVVAHFDGYLERQLTNVQVRPLVATAGDFDNANVLLGGDVAGYDHDGIPTNLDQGDNQITPIDVTAIADAFGTTSADSAWNPLADVDGDGTVYIIDYNMATANFGNGEGLLYKAPASQRNRNENSMVQLIASGEAGGEITYSVMASNLTSLRAYALEMEINPEQYELVSFSDGLDVYSRAAGFTQVDGFEIGLISALYGRNNAIRDGEVELFSFTVRALGRVNEDDISISEASLLDADGLLSKAIISSGEAVPAEFSLSQNFPNPFNPTTTIDFSLPREGTVNLTVYNLLGQEVRHLVSGSVLTPGSYRMVWNSVDNSGRKVSSGLYFYRLVVDNKVIAARKMVLLK